MRIAKFSRNQYRRDWLVQHRGYERSQYRNFKAALDTQVVAVSRYIKDGGLATVQSHLGLLVNEAPVSAAYEKCYMSIGTKHAAWTYKRIVDIATKSEGVGFFSHAWYSLMSVFFKDHAGSRITSVTETTRERITTLLADSQDLPISERATYITDQLDSPDFNRNRSLMIARTESTTAAGYGAMIGADNSDYEVGKVWLPVMDSNTRPDHAAMDGSLPVGIDETFAVGDSDMLYPGDPAGSAREVIQCRCCLAIVPLLSASGVPVLKVR